MASRDRTVAYIMAQLAGADGVSARKMFGEYGIFSDGKTVGLISDDQLFIKITEAGRKLAPDAKELPAYPGAKPSLWIDPELWEDQDWLAKLICATADALPAPAPKRPKKRRPELWAR